MPPIRRNPSITRQQRQVLCQFLFASRPTHNLSPFSFSFCQQPNASAVLPLPASSALSPWHRLDLCSMGNAVAMSPSTRSCSTTSLRKRVRAIVKTQCWLVVNADRNQHAAAICVLHDRVLPPQSLALTLFCGEGCFRLNPYGAWAASRSSGLGPGPR